MHAANQTNPRSGPALHSALAVALTAALGLLALTGCTPAADDDAADGDMEVLETITIGEGDLSDDAREIQSEGEEPEILFATPIVGMGPRAEMIEGEVSVLSNGPDEPLRLSMTARGLAPGDHAWHIHAGACGSSAGVVLALSETEDREAEVGPLRVDQTGQVDLEVEVPPLTPAVFGSRDHSLHIHERSGIDHGPTVACATL